MTAAVQPVPWGTKPCEGCGTPITRRYGEGLARFQQRRYCTLACCNESRAQGTVAPFPTPAQAFTRAYRRALAAGVDLLEERDAVHECSACLRLPGECECGGVA